MAKERKYRLSFAGDTSLGDWYIKRNKNQNLKDRLKNDYLSFFTRVKPLVENSDYFILNLETVLAKKPKRDVKGKRNPKYDNATRMLNVLKDLGVTAVSLANNHTMDFGEKFLVKALKRLRKAKIDSFGAGKNLEEASTPLKIILKGRKSKKNVYVFTGMRAGKRYRDYGFFADQEKTGVNHLAEKALSRKITKIRKAEPESIIIVTPHWEGLNYKWVSQNPRIQKRCRAFIDAGANYIFGHGNHMLNDIEHYNGGTIAYSLGNFVFNSPGNYAKMHAPPFGLVVNLDFKESKDGTWSVNSKFYPILTDNRVTNYNSSYLLDKDLVHFEKYFSPLEFKKNDEGHIYVKSIKLPSENRYNIGRFNPTRLLEDYFAKMGVSLEKVDRHRIPHIGDNRVLFSAADSTSLGVVAAGITSSKVLHKEFLNANGFSVTKNELFAASEKERAREMAMQLPSAVLKPLGGNQAKGVTVGVETDAEFDLAWDEALKISKQKKVLVEENFQNGVLARYLVVENKCVAIAEFTKPFITGNGRDTIKDLIEKKNETRKLNPHIRGGLLVINEVYEKNIKEQGYSLSSVPEKDVEVILDHKANPQIGSDTIDITNNVHPKFKKLAENTSRAIPGLSVTGIDLLAWDHTVEPTPENYRIIEVNYRPGLGGHLYPLYGTPRDVIEVIGNHILKTIKVDQLKNSIKELPLSLIKDGHNNKSEASLNMNMEPNEYSEKLPSTNKLLEKEFKKKGYEGSYLMDHFIVPIDGEKIIFKESLSSNFSLYGKYIMDNQYWYRKFLREDKLSIPEGKFFQIECRDDAYNYANKFNMRVKLEYRKSERIVSSPQEFDKAWSQLVKIYDNHHPRKFQKKRGVLITRHSAEDVKARYLIIDGHCVGVIQYVPSSNKQTETMTITSEVHPKLKQIAEKAAKIVVGLDIIGVDITSPDHTKDPDVFGYGIVNYEIKPSILDFHYPTYGEPLNIAKVIVDYSIHWASIKKQFDQLASPVRKARIMNDNLYNNRYNYTRRSN